MQAGARPYPVPPLPRQHLSKPGSEAALRLAPLYDAPHYRGSEKLKHHVAIVTGGDSGIGRSVAVLFAREGADVVVVYLAEHADAQATAQAVEAEGRRCELIAGDLSSAAFCRRVVRRTMARFGRLDTLVNNAAFQLHARTLDDLTPAHFERTVKTNLYGMYYLTRAASPMTEGAIHAWTRTLAAQPEEISPAYVFLASPQTASYITGEILPIIGGYD